MAQTILYYPKININDGAWLRNAVLYWDEVSSIVPYKNYEEFSPELSYLQSLGIYSAIYPRDLFYSEYSEDFCDCIVKRIANYDREFARKTNRTSNRQYARIHKEKIYAPALYELIHYKKIPHRLFSIFEERGLVNGRNTSDWIEMDSKIAQIYMRTLAEYSIKCSQKDIVLGTDTSTHNREIYSPCRNRVNLQAQCCVINIEKCLPQPSMDVSFEDILEFKSRRKDELNAFREKIRGLERNIYHADSPELIRHYEAQFREGWQRCSRDYYKALKDSKITFFLNSFVSLVGTPFVGQQLSSYIGQEVTSTIQTGAQLVNIGIGYFNYKNKISPAKTDGGFSYIIKANRDGIIQI